MMNFSAFILIVSGFIHIIFVAGIYWVGPTIGIKIYLAVLLPVEFLTGLMLGYISSKSEYKRVLVAAATGALVGFLPPILATYGLALAAAPVFLIYLGVLYFGMRFSPHKNC